MAAFELAEVVEVVLAALTEAHESELSEPELVPESLPVLLPELALLLLAAPWACRAAIRLCMNCWKAAAMVVASELEVLPEEELPEEEPAEEVLEVEAVDEVLSEVESVLVVLDELLSAPLDCRACMMASMSPPPGGGGGALVEWVELLSPAEALDCVELKYRDGSHCRELELPSELTLMLRTPG